jgi:hypothetical protein
MTYFEYKGKEYTSLEAMPSDVSAAYAKWRQEQNLPDDLLEFYEQQLRDTAAEIRGDKPLPGSNAGQRMDLLPSTCPSCGGPLNGENVHWTGDRSADCRYCGVNLPLRAEQ